MSVGAQAEEFNPGTLEDITQLISSPGGVISGTARLPTGSGAHTWQIHAADLGDLSGLFDHVAYATDGTSTRSGMNGAGGSPVGERASQLAAAEALERYASCAFDEDQFIWATAHELGDDALPLGTLPRCSERELANPACPIESPDPTEPMRWVRGVRLHDGAEQWVPAVLVYLYIVPLTPGERIWMPITTGCAAHTDIREALVGALCEVIERDAISLTWLQRLTLPRLTFPDGVPAAAQEFLAANRTQQVETHLFDATTDLGVPTVYCLEITPHADGLGQLVTCATDLEPEVALVKALREAVSTRIALADTPDLPEDTDEFIDVMHGAAHMGAHEQRSAFDFLTGPGPTTAFEDMSSIASGDPGSELLDLVERLSAAGMTAWAVDLTTDEAWRAGFRVVRVVVPELQPLSFSPAAQFKGHPRLYDGPRQMGHTSHDETALNPHPQPFA